MDEYLLREAEHKETVAQELEKSPEPAVLKEAARQREAAAELRREHERRQQPAAAAPAPDAAEPAAPMSHEDATLHEFIVDVIKSCYDPEIPINIYDLGLIYAVRLKDETPAGRVVEIDMTLTAPGCPAAGILPGEVEGKVRTVPGVADVKLDLVWEPPWDQSKTSQAARLQLGIDW